MQTATLNLETLHQLSEGLADDFAEQLTAAVLDCRQRPALAQKREVTLKLTIHPDPEDPDDVLITPVTTRKTPARKIQPVRARRSHQDKLQFDVQQ